MQDAPSIFAVPAICPLQVSGVVLFRFLDAQLGPRRVAATAPPLGKAGVKGAFHVSMGLGPVRFLALLTKPQHEVDPTHPLRF